MNKNDHVIPQNMIHQDSPLIVVVGPTGVGKTVFSIELASQVDGEIISADSRQVYKGLDIGTAKPTKATRKLIKHSLISLIRPEEIYNLAQFKNDALISIDDTFSRSKLPLLVGGTGQYIWGLLEDWDISKIPPNDERRSELDNFSTDELLCLLKSFKSDASEKVDPKNPRRIIRAIEKEEFLKTHPKFENPDELCGISDKSQSWTRILILGLTLPRDELYRRIDQRVEMMVRSGWIDEVKTLIDSGIDHSLPSMSSLGYTELISFLEGEISLDIAVEKIKFAIHRFARGQYSWFRLDDQRINWFDVRETFDTPIKFTKKWIRQTIPN